MATKLLLYFWSVCCSFYPAIQANNQMSHYRKIIINYANNLLLVILTLVCASTAVTVPRTRDKMPAPTTITINPYSEQGS